MWILAPWGPQQYQKVEAPNRKPIKGLRMRPLKYIGNQLGTILMPAARPATIEGAIGQLPLPKFSQTYVFVRRSNKLHHIASPRKYQLVAILTVATLCMGPIVASYVGALKQDMWALDWTHSGVLAGIVTWQRSVSFCLRQMWLRIYQ